MSLNLFFAVKHSPLKHYIKWAIKNINPKSLSALVPYPFFCFLIPIVIYTDMFINIFSFFIIFVTNVYNVETKNKSKAAFPNNINPIIALIKVANITAPAEISFAIPTILLYLL